MNPVLWAVLGLCLTAPSSAFPSRQNGDVARLAAVRDGLRTLRSHQHERYGYFGTQHHVGTTSLAIMAFLAAGERRDKSTVPRPVQRGVGWLVNKKLVNKKRPTPAGRLAQGTFECYEHGLALMALAEVYGMIDEAKLEERIREKVIDGILAAQESQRAGGWGYKFDGRDHDLSVTVMMLNGLRACEGAGFSVKPGVKNSAIGFVRKCRDASGAGYRYTPAGHISAGTVAAGIVSMQVMGGATSRNLTAELGVMIGYLDSSRGGLGQHACYAAYYLAQACFQAGGDVWRQQYPKVVRHLLELRSLGQWGASGPLHDTAMAVIALSAPERQLPVYTQVKPKERRSR